jgi:adenosylcobinamide-phosphate synthase
VESRPELGDGRTPGVEDVHRAARLSLGVGGASALLCALMAAGVSRALCPVTESV